MKTENPLTKIENRLDSLELLIDGLKESIIRNLPKTSPQDTTVMEAIAEETLPLLCSINRSVYDRKIPHSKKRGKYFNRKGLRNRISTEERHGGGTMGERVGSQHKSFKQNKHKRLRNQLKTVFDAFNQKPQTMKEVSVKTGIDRANICWYCRAMKLKGSIVAYKKTVCSITRHWATQWTTDHNLFPKQKQLPLF